MTLRKILALALIASFVFASTVYGQSAPWSTAAFQSWRQGVTPSGRMGVPRIPTASLPTCAAAHLGMVVLDTTTSTFKVCDGTTFDEMGAAGGDSPLQFNDDTAIVWGTGSDASCQYDTTQTPDTLVCGVSADSRHIVIAEKADIDANFDFAHAQSTHPTVFIHSANQNTSQWIGFNHTGTNGIIDVGTGVIISSDNHHFANGTVGNPSIGFSADGTSSGTGFWLVNSSQIGTSLAGVLVSAIGGTTGTPTRDFVPYTTTSGKALTESSATAVVQIGVPSGSSTGGLICYTVQANDASNWQARRSCFSFAAVNPSGTETCAIQNLAGTAVTNETNDGSGAGAISSGTLTYAITCTTTPTNGILLNWNAVSSLTQTTLQIVYRVYKDGGTGVITGQ